MLDRTLLEILEGSGVRYCVIGGIALAVYGYARYTADVDLLTMDTVVLRDEFWRDAAHAPEVRVGSADDPLAGLVRWSCIPPHDLLVGRGHAMRFAVDSAHHDATLGAPVATPLALVLLKLEAGGPQDRNDIIALADAQATVGSSDWRVAIDAHLPMLSEHARAVWAKVVADLPR